MGLPMIGGIFATMAFHLVDTWFVGQLGARELAAMSFTFPVVMVLTSVSIGLGAGTSSVLARAIGSDDPERARRRATDALVLSFLVTLALSALGIATIPPLFRLLGAPADMIPLIGEYMRIWYLGAVFLVVPMVGMSAIRATGDTRLPMMVMVGGAVVNVILDPLLIFGLGPVPGYGLEGAAIASVIARVMMFVAALGILHFHMQMLSYERPTFGEIAHSWREILHVGLPAAGTNAIIPICNGVVTAMLAGFGPNVVAGYGVATRVESMSLIIFYAMSAVIGPIVGQNLSAGKRERMHRALRLSTGFMLGFGLLLAAALALAARPIAELFNEQETVVEVATVYFWIVPLSYGTAGMVMVMNAAFNGMGKPLPAVVISVMRMAVIYLPLAWLGGELFGYAGIFAAYALANAICGIGAYVWAQRACDVQRRREAPAPVAPQPGPG